MKVPCKNIPTYNYKKNEWRTTSFTTQLEFGNFLKKNCFKEPGEYNFTKDVFKWNEVGRRWTETERYTEYSNGTPEYEEFWDEEEMKSRLGVIWETETDIFYTTRDYYFLLNYCPIVNKEKGFTETFADIRDVQYHMMMYEKLAEIFHKHSAILKRRQMLFEQPHSSLILAKDGWTTMGEVRIGDEIRNPDGGLCTIIDKSDNGVKDIYSVLLDDGTNIECGEYHLWEVYKSGSKKPLVLKTKELIDSGLYLEFPYRGTTRKEFKYRINNINKIIYTKNDLPIDPYVLGVLLGDGNFSKSQVSFTTYDEDIANKVFTNLGEDYEEGYKRAANGKDISFNINYKYKFNKEKTKGYKNNQYGCNPLLRELDNLGLQGLTGKDKFIPDIYKYSSIEDRIQLIQGLMDTDGYINKVGRDIQYTTISSRLASDIWILFKELGLSSIISTKQNEYGLFYRVRVCGKVNIPLFYTFRKELRLGIRNNKDKRQSFKLNRRIVDIVKTGRKEECSCIMVDHPNHLYITNGYTITHNSFCHVAKSINYLWFENKKRLKWFASDDSFIDDVNGSWVILNQYKTHLQNHTDWKRGFSPDRGGEIIQRQQVKMFGKWEWEGSQSSLVGKTLNKNPKLGVGGPTYWSWYEEGGIAPTADITLQYMESAITSGLIRVGSFCIGGSVGDLKECKPLEGFIKDPDVFGMYKCPTKWFDTTGASYECGLFIPAQYGMPEATDEFGNSDIKLAIELLDKAEFIGFKAGEYGNLEDALPWKRLPVEQYILKKSQNPRTIQEAFAWREMSFFNAQILQNTIDKVDVKKPTLINCELFEDKDGEIKWKNIDERAAITVFPFKGIADLDKRGCVQIYELPKIERGETEPQSRMYFAGVDPIQTDITTTSNSLFCIYIFKNVSRTKYKDEETGEIRIKTEGYKPVAWYIGRYADRKQTNTQAEYLVRMYNAFALVESNVTSFIDHMRSKNIENKYLMTKREANRIYGEDIVSEGFETGVGYGINMTMTGKLKNHILNKEKQYAEEILGTELNDKGEITRTIYGAERIPDIGLLREFMGYRKGINTDRIVAFGLALSACEMYAHSGVISDIDETDTEPDIIKLPPNKIQFFSEQKTSGKKRKSYFSSRMKL